MRATPELSPQTSVRATPVAAVAVLLASMIVAPAHGAAPRGQDWPQYRGPRRDGVSSETGLLSAWPADGLPQRWRVPLGAGYSGLSVVGDRLYTLFGRDGGEYLAAFDTADGSEAWRLRLGGLYRDGQGDGPRSTPTVHDGRVFAVSGGGFLMAADARDGSPLWRHDLRQEYRASMPRWGYSASPLVVDDMLLVEVGGRDAAIMAFDIANGEEIWRALDDNAGYSAPLLIEFAGRRQAVFFTGERLVGLDPSSGELLWSIGWKTSYGVNAATPIFLPPDEIFVASGYGVGSSVIRLKEEAVGGGVEIETAWRSRDLKNQFSSSVLVDGHLYGFDNSILQCLEIVRGERMWRARGHGHGSLLYAEGHLYVLGDRGSLSLVQATAGEYVEVARTQVFSGRSWTAPTLSDGTLYLRDERELVALDLTEPEAN